MFRWCSSYLKMNLFNLSIVILTIIAIHIIYANAEPNARNSTKKAFKYIISDGVQDFAFEDW